MLVEFFFGAAVATVVALLAVWARRASRTSFEEKFHSLLDSWEAALAAPERHPAALLRERLAEMVRERRLERLNGDLAVAVLACLWAVVLVGMGTFLVGRLVLPAELTWGDGLRLSCYISVSAALVAATFALDVHSRRRASIEGQHKVYRETGNWPQPGEDRLQPSPLLQAAHRLRTESIAAARRLWRAPQRPLEEGPPNPGP
ncbi:MAG: hypothetical protein ACRC20_14015 [Segniliparus sp.]|uniref:hypothetical protein n=1 Tax=Segniliparus sp. TaxID=2804064 RepID=UPI003F35FAD0